MKEKCLRRYLIKGALLPLLAFLAILLTAAPSFAVIGGMTIGGCIYTGESNVTYTPTGPAGTPVGDWHTKYAVDGTSPIPSAQVLIQNQHSGGAFVGYPAVDGNGCWEWTMADTNADGTPDVTDLIVMYSAPGHDVTSREWTWDPDGRFSQDNWGVLPVLTGGAKWPGGPTKDHFIHPTGTNPKNGGTVDAYGKPLSLWVTGPQDAYLMPFPVKPASLLHYVFYDNFTDGNDNGPIIDQPLNGATVRIFDEHGTLVASQVSGFLATSEGGGGFITDDGVVFAGAMADGYVYFRGLPGNEDYIIETDPSTVTQAANPHFTLSMAEVVGASCTEAGDRYNYELATCKWYQTYTEEGTHAAEAPSWAGTPGTMDGGYLTWHSFVEKLPNSINPNGLLGNPAMNGRISGTVLDSTGADPLEAPVGGHGGRVPPTNARFEPVGGQPGVAWNRTRSAANWGDTPNPAEPASDVIPNSRVMDGRVILYSLDGTTPKVVATAVAGTGQDFNDPANGGEFEFTDVPPGTYGLYAMDRNLYYVMFVGAQVTLTPGANISVPMLYERWGARSMGFVERNGGPVPGLDVKKWYKSGATKGVATTNANGWFLERMWWETGQMGVQYVDPIDGADWRGKIVTEQFQDIPTVAETQPIYYNWLTHNSISRSVGYATHNYFVDLQIEDIPSGVGNLIGAVFNDHFDSATRMGDGIYDDETDRLWQGWNVELYEAPPEDGDTCASWPNVEDQGLFANALIGTRQSGVFSKSDAVKAGWNKPYTYPMDEIGSMHASPVLFFPGGGANVALGAYAPAPTDYVASSYLNIGTSASETARFIGDAKYAPMPGFYEFRNLAPGNYCVRVMPKAGFSRSNVTADPGTGFVSVTVTGGINSRVDLGVNTTPPGSATGIEMAGELEGGMWDGMQAVDTNPTSLLWMDAIAMFGSPIELKDGNDYFLAVGFQGDTRCHAYNNNLHPPGTSMLDPTDPDYDDFACRSTIQTSAKPELERRFAPGANRYIGNAPGYPWNRFDPSVPAHWGGQPLPPARGISFIHNPAYESMELGIGVFQAGYKFEAAWTPLVQAAGGGLVWPICASGIVTSSFVSAPWGATATVTLTDSWSRIGGADVFGTWSTGDAVSCTTSAAGIDVNGDQFGGQCSMILNNVNQGDVSVTFSLNNVVPAQNQSWYIYDANGLAFCQTSAVVFDPAGTPPDPPPALAQCEDGIDNDGDGLIDFGTDPINDDGCTSATDNDEFTPPPPPPPPVFACSDGLDNDGDWLIDFNGVDLNADGDFVDPGEFAPDPGCSDIFDTDEADPPPTTGASHVISMTGIPTFGEKLFADVTVIVEDDGNVRVQGATANFSYTWLKEGVAMTNTGSCTSNVTGTCIMTTGGMDKATSVTVTLDSITHANLSYAPADNTVPTTITVPNTGNQAPAPTAGAIVITEGDQGTSQIDPNDPNAGDTHTYSISTPPSNGTASVSATGLVTYNSATVGTDSLVVTVDDGWGAIGLVTITVAVNGINHAPAPTAPAIVTYEGVDGTSQVTHGDPDAGDTLSYSISVEPVSGTATVSVAGLVTYTPGIAGNDSLVVTVTDAAGLTGTVSIGITVNVLATNNAPVPTAPAIVTDEGVDGTSQVTHGDPDAGDTLSYSISTAPVNGTATVSVAGLITYTPGIAGNDSLVVTVTDAAGATGTVAISITVNAPPPVVNGTVDVVVLTPAVATIAVGDVQTLSLTAENTTGQTLSRMEIEYNIPAGLNLTNLVATPAASRAQIDTRRNRIRLRWNNVAPGVALSATFDASSTQVGNYTLTVRRVRQRDQNGNRINGTSNTATVSVQ